MGRADTAARGQAVAGRDHAVAACAGSGRRERLDARRAKLPATASASGPGSSTSTPSSTCWPTAGASSRTVSRRRGGGDVARGAGGVARRTVRRRRVRVLRAGGDRSPPRAPHQRDRGPRRGRSGDRAPPRARSPSSSGWWPSNRCAKRLRAQLMLALYRAGTTGTRPGDLSTGCATSSRRELGLEPGPALKRLEHAILTSDPALDLRSAPPTTGATPRRRSRSASWCRSCPSR